ncbi:MAG: hypothetical protein OEU26_25070, partial [Candidatus Tectomicrobia bacterium]|nr:hypothetical protein [Candidatus Tectomicrobia bacterium]
SKRRYPITSDRRSRDAAPPYNRGAFPIQHAFVVQLAEATVLDAEHLSGRVEHIVSGQASHFESPKELLRFLEQVLQTFSSIQDG